MDVPTKPLEPAISNFTQLDLPIFFQAQTKTFILTSSPE
tara:strand:- start:8035 stop:8151 length:117 start_codon:yes stop_codon:yes gene_type:complete